MNTIFSVVCGFVLLTAPLLGQGKRLWVLRSPGEMVEYDPATFAVKRTVKVPGGAVQSPQSISVNHVGQILFAPAVSLPLSDEETAVAHKVWFWNGQAATTIDQGVKREIATTGSNQAVTETAPAAYLAADGGHLFWFANQARRLQREDIDLSVSTTWQSWQTDTSGGGRAELTSFKLPDCRCPSGTCEESCPQGEVWVPESGVEKFFVMTQVVAGKGDPVAKASTVYQEDAGKWKATPTAEPLKRLLDAASGGNVIVKAIPDTSCCGWSNQSDDQTLVLANERTIPVFDELATYKNPDYDVSFYTSRARLSPDLGFIAMTIESTAQANKPIQLAEQGQASVDEVKQIRKSMADLPAVEVKSMEMKSLEDSPKRVAFLPHAALVGWINEKEILIVEGHVLVAYNVRTGERRKSSVRVEDTAMVFLR